MKVTAGQYAKALYELTKDKSEKEIKQVILGFAGMLKKNRQLKNTAKITDKFGEIWNEANEIFEASVTSREKLSAESLKKIEDFLKDKYKAKKVFLENKLDERIVGGVIIRIGNDVIDASIKNNLNNLKKYLTA